MFGQIDKLIMQASAWEVQIMDFNERNPDGDKEQP